MNEKRCYGVGQLNKYIDGLLKEDFLLSDVSVCGEVSNLTYHKSGHIYFSLKDSEGVMSAVMFAQNAYTGLTFKMREGDKVIARGRIGVYAQRGSYQLYANSIKRAGEGDLYQELARLKKELEEMGMFDPLYKKPIPAFVKKIGVVTAPTGAAVRDIINISKRRNPFVEIILYPAIVQGDLAASSIIDGIQKLDEMGLDVIIAGRGGGSIEDLWAFNERAVVEAFFNAKTPIISAVGHETDTTLSDYAADLRAPTPSAAAELANFDYNAMKLEINRRSDRLEMAFENVLQSKRDKFDGLRKNLSLLSPEAKVEKEKARLNELNIRLQNVFDERLKDIKNRTALLAAGLDGLSPAKKLSLGFGYVSTENGKVTSVCDVKVGEELLTYVGDGMIKSTVTDLRKDNK